MARDALNMRQEVVSLCAQVERYGNRSSDGTEQITFGELFKINELISSRFACILESSRKYRLMDFPGTSLCKDKDENVIISLSRKNREIQEYFRHTKNLLPNHPEGNLWIDIDCDAKAHYDWVTHVRETSPSKNESYNSASVSVHLGSVCTSGKPRASAQKTSYHVTCHEADSDEVFQKWQDCSPFATEGYNPTKAEELMEPHVIFKLLRVTVNKPSIVCDPLELCDTTVGEEVKEISDIRYMNAEEKLNQITYERVTKVTNAIVKNCPEKIQKKETKEREIIHMEIRPLVRLFRKTSPSPPPTTSTEVRPHYVKPRAKADINAEIEPPLKASYTRKLSYTETPKSTIKFSTSTALYTPAKPSYANYSKQEDSSKYETQRYRPKSVARSSLFSSYNLTARARSEFRERSIPMGRRSYVSLYS